MGYAAVSRSTVQEARDAFIGFGWDIAQATRVLQKSLYSYQNISVDYIACLMTARPASDVVK